jgi:hypothetical protein
MLQETIIVFFSRAVTCLPPPFVANTLRESTLDVHSVMLRTQFHLPSVVKPYFQEMGNKKYPIKNYALAICLMIKKLKAPCLTIIKPPLPWQWTIRTNLLQVVELRLQVLRSSS